MITVIKSECISGGEYLDRVSTYLMPEIIEADSIFGTNALSEAVEEVLDCDEIDEDDGYEFALENSWAEVIAVACKKTGRRLSRKEMEDLKLSEGNCEVFGIPIVEMDEEGNEIKSIPEPKEQMHLFPEMEAGLPPYRMKIVLPHTEVA